MREGLYPLGLSGGGHFDRAPFSGTSILVPQLLRKPTWLGKWHFGQAYSFGLFGRTRALPKSIIPMRHQIQRYFMTRPPSRSSSPTACRGSPIPGRLSCRRLSYFHSLQYNQRHREHAGLLNFLKMKSVLPLLVPDNIVMSESFLDFFDSLTDFIHYNHSTSTPRLARTNRHSLSASLMRDGPSVALIRNLS